MKPRPTGAVFLQVFLSSQQTVERDMTNAVKTEIHLYNSSGNRDRCLERTYNCLMSVGLHPQSLHSPQQMFSALTCALASLMTPLIFCVSCLRINVKTTTNVDSSLTVLLAVSLSSLPTPAVPSDLHRTVTANTVQRLLWTLVLHVNFPVCRKNRGIGLLKIFIFTIWQSRPTYTCVPCPRSTFAHATLICTFLTNYL